jgi:hypothetical protein
MDVEDRHTLGTFIFPLFKLQSIFYAIIKTIQKDNISRQQFLTFGNKFCTQGDAGSSSCTAELRISEISSQFT